VPAPESPQFSVATIGYEGTTVAGLLDELRDAKIELLVDVRAIAGSRRPGFAKTKLASNLADAGIEYLHLRGLGTPSDGRAAARAGRHEEMRTIFLAHLQTAVAQADLDVLAGMVRAGRRICLLCLEAEPAHCHRSMVAAALGRMMPLRIDDLRPSDE
jgi:uncharacterized protein (DUF488 family)